MTNFDFYKYLNLGEKKVLKMRIKNQDDPIFVFRVSQSVVQAYQPAKTPITKINLDVVKNISLYKQDKEDEENYYVLRVEPEEVEQFELVEI